MGMIIDFHTHVFPDTIAKTTIEMLEQRSGVKASTDGTLNDLVRSMECNGVDVSVLLPVVTKPQQFESINKFAQFVNSAYGSHVISFGGIHPDCEDYKAKLRQIKEMGIQGIKIHPDYQKVMIDDIRYMNIIEYASELDLIVVTHAGVDIGLPQPVHCPPDRARKVIDTIKPKKFILAHYGGLKQWEEVYEYIAGSDVYLDTAITFDYIEQEMFMKIWNKHDKKKILFATDSPWSDAKEGIKAVRALPISEEEKEDILSGNAKQLIRLC